jgi:hypothetical protein
VKYGLTDVIDFEYIPDCCLRDCDAFYHPWLYSGLELDVLEAARHERYVVEEERKRRERENRARMKKFGRAIL